LHVPHTSIDGDARIFLFSVGLLRLLQAKTIKDGS
jgi:hypothetical protein